MRSRRSLKLLRHVSQVRLLCRISSNTGPACKFFFRSNFAAYIPRNTVVFTSRMKFSASMFRLQDEIGAAYIGRNTVVFTSRMKFSASMFRLQDEIGAAYIGRNTVVFTSRMKFSASMFRLQDEIGAGLYSKKYGCLYF